MLFTHAGQVTAVPRLQMFGFTCGMSDVLLVHSANARRAELLDGADVRALDAAAQFVGVPSPLALTKEGLSPVGGQRKRVWVEWEA